MANVRAGRDVVKRLRQLERERTSFIYETNLVDRSLVPRLTRLHTLGYHTEVIFVGLRHRETAVARVQKRVRSGGIDVPERTIQRRWARGLNRFFSHYQFAAHAWSLFDNEDEFVAVARGDHSGELVVMEPELWHEYLNLVGTQRRNG